MTFLSFSQFLFLCCNLFNQLLCLTIWFVAGWAWKKKQSVDGRFFWEQVFGYVVLPETLKTSLGSVWSPQWNSASRQEWPKCLWCAIWFCLQFQDGHSRCQELFYWPELAECILPSSPLCFSNGQITSAVFLHHPPSLFFSIRTFQVFHVQSVHSSKLYKNFFLKVFLYPALLCAYQDLSMTHNPNAPIIILLPCRHQSTLLKPNSLFRPGFDRERHFPVSVCQSREWQRS